MECQLAFLFGSVLETHHGLPAASLDLGGLALGSGNESVVTQALGLSFPPEFSEAY